MCLKELLMGCWECLKEKLFQVLFFAKKLLEVFFCGEDAFCSLLYVCNLNVADYEIVINICKTFNKKYPNLVIIY